MRYSSTQSSTIITCTERLTNNQLLLLLLLLLLTKKFNVAFSPEELQGHGTHVNRRRVQHSTVLVEGRNCAISMTWQTSTSSNAAWMSTEDINRILIKLLFNQCSLNIDYIVYSVALSLVCVILCSPVVQLVGWIGSWRIKWVASTLRGTFARDNWGVDQKRCQHSLIW